MYRFNEAGRIVSTLEPNPAIGPLFTLIRGRSERVWAVGATVASDLADELDALAIQEQPSADWREPPRFANRYRPPGRRLSGPAWSSPRARRRLEFPNRVDAPEGVSLIEDVRMLLALLRGLDVRRSAGPQADSRSSGRWTLPSELDGSEAARSLCSGPAHRRGGRSGPGDGGAVSRAGHLAERVTASWAIAVRASGRVPLYSTSWENAASLAVARKLGLSEFTST